MNEFAERTAVITGGASGIGFAFAKIAAERQMNVVLADIEEAALQNAVRYFEDQQLPVRGVLTDVSRRDALENLLQESIDAFGKVHLLFNNAGVSLKDSAVPVWERPMQDWQWIMGVNFDGLLNGLQVFTPHMTAHGEEGHIINTSSIAAFIPGSGPYGVSKLGIVNVSESLAFDLQAAGSKIGASVICPGRVNTRIGEAERNRPSELNDGQPIDVENLPSDNPQLADAKSPEELASLVFESIEQERFYILPHSGWDYMVRDHAEAMLNRQGPYLFDFPAHMAMIAEGADI